MNDALAGGAIDGGDGLAETFHYKLGRIGRNGFLNLFDYVLHAGFSHAIAQAPRLALFCPLNG